MNDYTIVEPSFELWGTNNPDNYIQLLEKATRTCYKSEEHIKEGSAEKLMNKVVNKFGHHSVIEHASAIIEIGFDKSEDMADFILQTLEYVPLFATRMSQRAGFTLILSGNFRMWRRAIRMASGKPQHHDIWNGIGFVLGNSYPFFFTHSAGTSNPNVRLLDNDPKTNKSHLSKAEMLRHCTLTGKFIGSRAMSHQLVRHRMAAYSQESQRYCNYGEKGFQFIVPPSLDTERDRLLRAKDDLVTREEFCLCCVAAYNNYLRIVKQGIPPEDARHLLPNACKTEVVATYTLEIWVHTIEHRGHNPKAQWEIRDNFLEAEKQINEYLGWNICEK